MFLTIRQRLGRDEGFTLIELLVVVIIIGILAAVAIPTFLNQRERAYRSAVQSDLRNLAVEAETHFTDAQVYTGFAIPAGFGSQKVNGNYEGVVSDGTYCFEAHHDAKPAEIWKIEPGNKLVQADCGATAVAYTPGGGVPTP